jgi:hypothetical protein
MNRFPVVIFILFSILVLISCTQTQAPPAAPPDTRVIDQKAISDSETAWVAEWKAQDLEKIVGHYADDAVVMDPDVPAVKGKDAIRKQRQGDFGAIARNLIRNLEEQKKLKQALLISKLKGEVPQSDFEEANALFDDEIATLKLKIAERTVRERRLTIC